MKQILQSMKTGETRIVEVPTPAVKPGTALVKTAASLVSAGTERMVVEFAGKNLIEKARSRPDLVRQLLDKARREGVVQAIGAAFNRLDQPMSLGYSSAGLIVETGEGLRGYKAGDRVACAGSGFAVHGEYAVVPQNLMAKLPASVSYEEAAFTTIAAISLHGVRLAHPQIGEHCAVIGMGLLGLITAMFLRTTGCKVTGIELSPERLIFARSMGFTCLDRRSAAEAVPAITRGLGFDAVLICADTPSSDPVELAGEIARDRARIVAVGNTGFTIPRKVYYEKELNFLVSRSYGPGRYDDRYELEGVDYPAGYIRWTEGRNLQAVIDLIDEGRVDFKPLISHRIPIERGEEAYQIISGAKKEPFMGVLLTYSHIEENLPVSTKVWMGAVPERGSKKVVGVFGAGNYAASVFLPVIHRAKQIDPHIIVSEGGRNAVHLAKKFGYAAASSREEDLLQDPKVTIAVILTRHNNHAALACSALKSGKHVFCEKPIAIHPNEVVDIQHTLEEYPDRIYSVGYNRRFAPYSIRLRDFFSTTQEPLVINYRVNAGFLPLNHWLHNPDIGGGRIIGEGCHFIDYLIWLTGSSIDTVSAATMPNIGKYNQDNVTITLGFKNGSLGTIHYLANGDKSFPKERVEVFSAGRIAILDDYRRLDLIEGGKRQRFTNTFSQDKGHLAGWMAFLSGIDTGKPPIPYEELFWGAAGAFAAVRSQISGQMEKVG